MMSTVYLTIGIPASGKTTWAKKQAQVDKNIVVVSRDDIRNAHGWKSGFDENRVTRIHRAQIEAALLEGMDVIVADTNINKTFRNRLVKFCHEHGADVQFVPFPISVDEAILRDSARNSHMVGPQIIMKFYEDLCAQDLDYDGEFHPAPKFNAVPRYTHDSLADAIVVDIDGTVAERGNRSPYDESRVISDSPISDVINIVKALSDKYEIIIVSGRTDSCRDDTVKWIGREFGEDFEYTLHMRKTGDQRPDYIIKNEIYDSLILPQNNVIMAFDDRDQVVRHVRSRGITVAQVAPGRF
jgi:predicted kinase